MIIEKITLCNLTSIRGEQTIDFTREPLRSAGLFAITGDTGSGKSTILDAICLALYGRAPRFDDAERQPSASLKNADDESPRLQAGDPRNILRRGEREGYAIVEFSTHDGSRYEAAWRLRKKRTGTIDRASRSLRRLSPKKETIDEREIATRLPEIIGLDYLQFSRTVLLAQNSFANFLKAKRGDKSALLEKLTGTEIYGSISQKIYQLTDEARRSKEAVENQITGILRDRLTPEDLAEKEQRRDFLLTACRNADAGADLLHRQLDWLERKGKAEAAVTACEQEQNEAYKACVAARDEELKVERYDAVQSVQPLFREIAVRRRDIETLKASEEKLVRDISAGEADALRIRSEFLAAREATLKAENNLSHRRPIINRGHALTGEIREGEEQLKKNNETYEELQQQVQQRRANAAAKNEELTATRNEREQQQLHLQELSVHKLMFEKFDLVKDKLNQFDTASRQNEEQHRKAVELQKQLTLTNEAAQKLEDRQHDNQGQLNTLKGELLIHQQTNSGLRSEDLQRQFAENRNRLVQLEVAATLWKHITEGYEEISEARAEISRHAVEQEQTAADIERLQREQDVAEEVYNRLNVALTLSHSENIVELRKQLKEGAACPVCGATHHPYHTETERELGELLNNLEKEYNEAGEKLQAKRLRLVELRKKLNEGKGRLQAEERALQKRMERQEQDVAQWQTCADLDPSFADCSPSVNREARRLMIELHADNAKKAARAAEEELKAFNFHQQHINRLNEEIAALAGRMDDDRMKLQSVRTQQQIITAALDDLQHALRLSDRTCSQLYIDLDEMITISAWFSTWKNNYDGFRTRLINLHHDWQHTCRTLDACEHRENQLREELNTLTAALRDAEKSLARAEDNLIAVRKSLEAKREELDRLFGGVTPEAEEETLLRNIAECRRIEAAGREAGEKADYALSQLRGAQQNAARERLDRQEEFRAKSRELDLWLLKFNSSHSPMQMSELEKIFADTTEWQALRKSLAEKHKRLTLAEHNLKARREALLEVEREACRPQSETECNREFLLAAEQRAVEQAAALHEELTTLQHVLMRHYNCLRDAEGMESQRQSVVDNFEQWNRLNALLGSADGKRFRELAQSYTFGYLVEQANYHLRRLSPRYELRTQPGTLQLSVVDHDMFDEERHVQSLSGGETFVASLALALGLSSLSGNQVTIGSLFIDEGFGNLDQDSLQLVMDALSRLEGTQGRKVGVVSHTPQIRSQIHPQVQLVKQPAGGRSEIRVR